ncbi:hypothetical protein ACOMCU_15870 [Lysinibacillus sp. UGB7]|uniref:hypothetical protein n=1 Tax=Lysinibacillus sp. UGB7 TaxID=3411039 RepID=UPI003B7F22E4
MKKHEEKESTVINNKFNYMYINFGLITFGFTIPIILGALSLMAIVLVAAKYVKGGVSFSEALFGGTTLLHSIHI